MAMYIIIMFSGLSLLFSNIVILPCYCYYSDASFAIMFIS